MCVLELARTFLDAIERGDIVAARACYSDDAVIWHNFDNKEKTVDENMISLEKWKKYVINRTYDLQRLELLSNGYLQQHILSGFNIATIMYGSTNIFRQQTQRLNGEHV